MVTSQLGTLSGFAWLKWSYSPGCWHHGWGLSRVLPGSSGPPHQGVGITVGDSLGFCLAPAVLLTRVLASRLGTLSSSAWLQRSYSPGSWHHGFGTLSGSAWLQRSSSLGCWHHGWGLSRVLPGSSGPPHQGVGITVGDTLGFCTVLSEVDSTLTSQLATGGGCVRQVDSVGLKLSPLW